MYAELNNTTSLYFPTTISITTLGYVASLELTGASNIICQSGDGPAVAAITDNTDTLQCS